MSSYAKHIIMGNVGRDAEMRYTQSGVPVTSVSLAVSKTWNDANGEKQEKTTWYRITFWRKAAESVAQWVKKGNCILVEGEEMAASAYAAQDGTPRASLELTGTFWRFAGDKRRDEGAGGEESTGYEPGAPDEDEIPF